MRWATCIVLCGTLVPAFCADTCPSSGQSLRDRAQPYLAAALAAGNDFVSVSAASGMPNLSPGSLATAFGANLAPRTEIGSAPYQTSLGGISLQVVDSAGSARLAPLLYVSATQINYVVPPGTAPGMATMHIVNGTGVIPTGSAPIQTVAPALFTANANGQGVVAATAYRTVIPSNIASPVPVYECGVTPGSCVPVPIALGVDTPVFVTFYATGVRSQWFDISLSVTIGGQSLPVRSVLSFDDSNALAGIDQVTVAIPLSLRNAGEVDVVVTAGGKTSNTGRIDIH